MRYLPFLSILALIGLSTTSSAQETTPEPTEVADLDQAQGTDNPVTPSSGVNEETPVEADKLDDEVVSDEQITAAIEQAEHVMGGAKENGYTRTLVEGDFYPVVHPIEVEWAIQQSLAREGVDIDTDDRFSLRSIRSLAGAIATVCDDMDCVLEALATGYLETRWRPDRVGAAGECGFAQQTPAYADELPELERLSNRERCRVLQDDQLTAVRQWYQKRQYWESRKGERWPCYYNAGYICTASGQYYMQNHRRYYQMYEQMFQHLVASDEIN
jgi:hypothetical protein